ncbi:MAG: NlpC/P60 family protein [Nocardioides sp.]|nr:NlpC/P60 family protein [Nocardioides sp.]
MTGISLVPTTPSSAKPDIDDVKTRVDRLYHEAEIATENHHDAELELKGLKADLKGLKADQKSQQQRVNKLSSSVNQAIAAQYEGQSISTTGQLVLSDDPQEFLNELTTLSSYNDTQSQAVSEYSTEADALKIRREATQERSGELADVEKELRENKAEADSKLEEAESLLDDLEAEERERLEETASRSAAPRVTETTPAPETTEAPPASGRAAAAIQYAMAQVGKSYVYGAAGPSSFDCSGLTMMAWGQAGVGLPHSSSAQMSSGSSVSSSDLQPGDLVFYYSPVSHVGIYIGNGQIVHAANPSTGVAIADVFSMPFSGAVRPG